MSGFDLRQLEAVFTHHVVQKLIGADARLTESELALLEATYPLDRMVVDGMAEEDGTLTDAYHLAREQALERLPRELEKEKKLALVTTFLDATVVDGSLDRSESSMLYQAARLLGLSSAEFDAHLDTLSLVGNVDLPEPEAEA